MRGHILAGRSRPRGVFFEGHSLCLAPGCLCFLAVTRWAASSPLCHECPNFILTKGSSNTAPRRHGPKHGSPPYIALFGYFSLWHRRIITKPSEVAECCWKAHCVQVCGCLLSQEVTLNTEALISHTAPWFVTFCSWGQTRALVSTME